MNFARRWPSRAWRSPSRQLAIVADEIVGDYRQLVTIVRATLLPARISRDPDDDAVIACAISARADAIITGDDDLPILGSVAGVAILRVAKVLGEAGV